MIFFCASSAPFLSPTPAARLCFCRIRHAFHSPHFTSSIRLFQQTFFTQHGLASLPTPSLLSSATLPTLHHTLSPPRIYHSLAHHFHLRFLAPLTTRLPRLHFSVPPRRFAHSTSSHKQNRSRPTFYLASAQYLQVRTRLPNDHRFQNKQERAC